MARRLKVEIKLESGKMLTHYYSVRIWQGLYGHNTFEIAVPFEMLENKEESFFSASHREVCGKMITVSCCPLSGSGSFDFLFKGIVTELTLNQSGSLSNGFLLKGYSPTIMLEDCRQRRIFLQQSLQQLIGQVLGQYPINLLKRQVNPAYQNQLRYVVQYDESNFRFLCRLAAQYGEWLYYNGSELKIGKQEDEPVKEFRVDGIQKFDLAVALQPLGFLMTSYNYLRHETYRDTSDSQPVPGLNTFGQFALQESNHLFGHAAAWPASRDMQEKSELDEEIKVRKAMEVNKLITFQGKGENPDLTLGAIIEVNGSRPGSQDQVDYGRYRITEMQHDINSNGNYQHHFKAVPDKAVYPPMPAELSLPKAYPELAKVTDNQDPEKLGRVKVHFFWPDESHAASSWLRVALPYTGAGSGMHFVPEVGAQVLVGYESGVAELPYVAGSLYHKNPNDPPDEGYTYANNSLKALRTKGGNRILWQDTEGDKAITLGNTKQDKSRITLAFEGDGSISIETDGNLLLKGKEIELDAQTSLRIKANSIEMSGQEKIEVKATEVKIQADASAEINAQSTLKLSGTSTELNGQASTKVTGATVDISGQAMVKLEAALVKLN